MPRLFGHGGLRLVLLSLLEDGERTGYEVIVALEERFLGMYRPSSGTIYPRLSALEEEGLISSSEDSGRRVYSITDRGREELARRRADLDDAVTSATSTVRAVIDDLQSSIRDAVANVQIEVRRQAAGEARQVADDVRRAAEDAAQDVRRAAEGAAREARRFASEEARRASEEARRFATEEARRVRRLADDLRRQARRERHDQRKRVRESRKWGDWSDWGNWNLSGEPRDWGDFRFNFGRHSDEWDEFASDVSAWAGEVADRLRDDAQVSRLREAFAHAKDAFFDALGDVRDAHDDERDDHDVDHHVDHDVDHHVDHAPDEDTFRA